MPLQEEIDVLPNWMAEQLKDLANGLAGSEGTTSLSPQHAAAVVQMAGGSNLRMRRVGGVHHIKIQDLVELVNGYYGTEVVEVPTPAVDPNKLLDDLEGNDIDEDIAPRNAKEPTYEPLDPNERASPNTRIGNRPEHTPLSESELAEQEDAPEETEEAHQAKRRTTRKSPTAPRPPKSRKSKE